MMRGLTNITPAKEENIPNNRNRFRIFLILNIIDLRYVVVIFGIIQNNKI